MLRHLRLRPPLIRRSAPPSPHRGEEDRIPPALHKARSLRPANVRPLSDRCNRSTIRLPTMRRRWGTPSSPPRGEVPSACEAMRGRSHSTRREAPSSGAPRHLLPAGETRDGQRLPSRTEKAGSFLPAPTLRTKERRPGVSSRPPAPYPPGPHAVRRFSGPAYSRPRVSLPRLSPHRPRPPLHAP